MQINPELTTSDRSFNYGDGLFSTVRVSRGQLQLWPLHLNRLQQGVERLNMPAIDEQQLTAAAKQAITAPEQVLKLLLSRGAGGRGYGAGGIVESHLHLSVAAMPDYQPWQQQGIRVGIAQLKLGCQPRLAGLKHNNRLEQVLLKAELAATDWDDLLVLDTMDRVTEATAANLFFYTGGVWHTPQLDQAGVAGVMRELLLSQLQPQQGYYSLSHLVQADAIFLCNALMQVVPVRQLADKVYDLEPVRAVQNGVLD
ncbi:aminodeoxychorismate lyase [Rheinheimera sp.]|uniref:aminodeoxychorismate lyase n=1 Tax=Rheinheimera sp. TaxID=1869214 RepID=UPI00307F8104